MIVKATLQVSMSLQGKIYAITGGASGIGLATAKLLSQRGAVVCIADVDPSAMEATKSYFESQKALFTITRVDISKRPQVEEWLDSIIEEYGRLDGAANLAGIIGKHHGLRAVADLDDDEWDKIIAVNLTGTMYCLRGQLRRIVDGGSIVNVASIHGIKGMLPKRPTTSAYQAIILSTHFSNCYILSRFRQSWCLRCKQARYNRPNKSSSQGERSARNTRQCRCSRCHLHAIDEEGVGFSQPLR